MRDAEFRQRLPGLNKSHLRLDEAHLGHVLVGFKDARRDLRDTPALDEGSGLVSGVATATPTG